MLNEDELELCIMSIVELLEDDPNILRDQCRIYTEEAEEEIEYFYEEGLDPENWELETDESEEDVYQFNLTVSEGQFIAKVTLSEGEVSKTKVIKV